jgi:uncharacterized protein YfaP (DUF2135 family)
MAVFSNLFEPVPDGTSLPATITFTAEVMSDSKSKPQELEIRLADSNKLVFGDGSKSVKQIATIGTSPVRVVFSKKKITGDPGEAAFFRVTLFDSDENQLDACLVALE